LQWISQRDLAGDELFRKSVLVLLLFSGVSLIVSAVLLRSASSA